VRRIDLDAGIVVKETTALGTPEETFVQYTTNSSTKLTNSTTDDLGRVTAYTYDSHGNVTSESLLDGTADEVTNSYSYEPRFNQLKTVTDPLNHTTTLSYFPNGLLERVTDHLGHYTRFEYDDEGRLDATVIRPGSQDLRTEFGYSFGDLATVTDPLGKTQRRFTDGAGRETYTFDEHGAQTRTVFDAGNLVQEIIDAKGHSTTFEYDANGNLTSLTDARNNETTFAYDDMDLVDVRTDPMANAESFDFDGLSRLTTWTDRNGDTTRYSYDKLGRRTFVGFDETIVGGTPSYQSTISFDYDDVDREVTITDSVAGVITRSYDLLDRLESEASPQGAVSYQYDDAGRRESMTVTGQPTVSYTFDNADRLTQLTRGTLTVTLGYDNADRRTSVGLPGGVSQSFNYDDASRISGITYANGSGTLGTLTYSRDAVGRLHKVTGSWARARFPDTVALAQYNANNQLTTWGATTLSYDDAGRLLSDGDKEFEWNARGELTEITSGTPGTTLATFEYDGQGRRVERTVSGTSTGYLYDGANPIQELSGTTPSANILTGLLLDDAFVRIDSGGTFGLLTEQLGSTVALTDSAGAATTSYSYEPFGASASTGSSSSNSTQFTGREHDATGLLFYRERYVDPTRGRFISEDPLRFGAGDSNLYAYVRNSPLTYTDPTGEIIPLLIGVGAAAGCGAYIAFMKLTGRKPTTRGCLGGAAAGAATAVGGYYAGSALGWWGASAGGGAAGQRVGNSLGSTGRTIPANLAEKTAMQKAMLNPTAGHRLPITMKDPRWPADEGWVKMAQNIDDVEIHYVYNTVTGAVDDFKYK
jgi:RHS repeat-associated protein